MKIKEYTKYIDSDEVLTGTEIYDSKNRKTSDLIFDINGNQEIRIDYIFEEDENFEKILNFDENNNLIEEKIIHYNNDKKTIKTQSSFPDGSLTINTYDRTENRLFIKSEDENGDFEGSTERFFDNNSNLLEYIQINDFEKKEKHVLNKYDNNGYLIQSDEKDERGKPLASYKFSLDEKGNCILEEKFNNKGKSLEKTSFQYDENGNIIKSRSTNANINYEYANNKLVREERIGVDGIRHITFYNFIDDKISSIKTHQLPFEEDLDNSLPVSEVRYEYID